MWFTECWKRALQSKRKKTLPIDSINFKFVAFPRPSTRCQQTNNFALVACGAHWLQRNNTSKVSRVWVPPGVTCYFTHSWRCQQFGKLLSHLHLIPLPPACIMLGGDKRTIDFKQKHISAFWIVKQVMELVQEKPVHLIRFPPIKIQSNVYQVTKKKDVIMQEAFQPGLWYKTNKF